MLMNLIRFEVQKKWMGVRYVLLGFVLVESLLLILSKLFLWNNAIVQVFTNNRCDGIGDSTGLTLFAYFALAAMLTVFAVVENIYRFERDLSGRHAVIEGMIPAASWKKLLAKAVAVLLSTAVCIGLSVMAATVYALFASRFDPVIVDSVVDVLQRWQQRPFYTLLQVIYLLFMILSVYMLVFFCTAVSKSLTAANRMAVPVSILLFGLLFSLLAALGDVTLQYPIVSFSLLGESSLSALMLSMATFSATAGGTAWLMTHRIDS